MPQATHRDKKRGMKTFLAFSLSCLLLASCGHPDALDEFRKNQRKPHAVSVNVWDGSDTLATNKQTIVRACQSRGASEAQTALVLAMAFQETQEMKACERDASKDGTPSMNYSAFNMNADCLQRLGWVSGNGPDLNQDSALDEAVGYILKGFQTFGEDGMLNFHRGGSTALADGVSYGACEYRDQMRGIQQYLLINKCNWTDNKRIGGYLQHV